MLDAFTLTWLLVEVVNPIVLYGTTTIFLGVHI